MAKSIELPRVDANDDEITIASLAIEVGQKVEKGDILIEAETSKTVFDIESEYDGYIIAINCKAGESVPVGTTLVWIGETKDELPPQANRKPEEITSPCKPKPTLKAINLLKKYGLAEADVPFSSERLTAHDIEKYISEIGKDGEEKQLNATGKYGIYPTARREKLGPAQKGMLNMVLWHRDIPSDAYLEIIFNQTFWRQHSEEFSRSAGLLLDPLLGLMAYKLVQLAKKNPIINSTIDNNDILFYEKVNLGFTIEANKQLYIVVVENAEQYDASGFLNKLGELQRKAFKKTLKKNEVSGATIAFTSLAKKGVSRHIPILPPRTSLMVGHSDGLELLARDSSIEPCVFGATYDHRILDGGVTAQILNKLAVP